MKVTHFLTGWVFANCTPLDKRGRTLVTLASVAPDLDGLGIIPELLTRNSSHPLFWFSDYHHSLHTLAFALVVDAISFIFATRKWTTGFLALLSFHLHLLEDLLGSRGPLRSMAHSVPEAGLFNAATHVAGTMVAECMAKYFNHSSVAVLCILAALATRILTA